MMKLSAKPVVAALAAALVVSTAFAQTKATTQKHKTEAPKDHKYSGKVVSVSSTSFTIKHGKKTLTVETAGATAMRDKKPFDLSQLTAGTKVTVRGTMSGSEVSAHKVAVGKPHTEEMKSSTKTSSHAKHTSSGGSHAAAGKTKAAGSGSYGSSGVFHGIGW